MDREFGGKTRLIAGGNGIFDVTVDGTLAISKGRIGRFPETDEVIAAIRKV